MGRPRKEIDQEQFEKLCGLQCTENEICAWFDVSDRTLERWCEATYNQRFVDVFAIKREKGKISLRRAQFKLAEKSAAMAIFLGKNYLGQRDSLEVENTEALNRLDDILKGLESNAGTERETE